MDLTWDATDENSFDNGNVTKQFRLRDKRIEVKDGVTTKFTVSSVQTPKQRRTINIRERIAENEDDADEMHQTPALNAQNINASFHQNASAAVAVSVAPPDSIDAIKTEQFDMQNDAVVAAAAVASPNSTHEIKTENVDVADGVSTNRSNVIFFLI